MQLQPSSPTNDGINRLSSLPSEAKANILSFLPVEDLMQVRRVETPFKNLVDSATIYDKNDSSADAKVHRAFLEYKNLHITEEKINTEISTLKASLKSDKEALSTKQKNWYGYSVSSVKHFPGISYLASYALKNMNNEVDAQGALEKKIDETNSRISQLMKDKEDVQIKMGKAVYKISYEFQPIEIEKKAMKFVDEIFGSREAFDKLPVLPKTSFSTNEDGGISIPKENMTHPIMRGIEQHGRVFFAIRATTGREYVKVQVFVRKYINDSAWVTQGDPILENNGYLHPKDERNNPVRNWLKELVKNGAVEFEFKRCEIGLTIKKSIKLVK